ncbi:Phosphohistidine phosphatase SixA [hydrothermal vent metagenome]|uniref:Phosphohistidine phosphatase SixA n=1 Tax=hydrothermal vent metagenome TaxID=652676 RepID=A0A3B0SWQ7_9ZZZZ
MKRLFLLRHAKAAFGTTDKTRPLAYQGQQDASWLGQHLKQLDSLPDHILCSSANRARETLENLKMGAETVFSTKFSDDLYLASADQMIGQVRQLAQNIKAPMIIGHNPGLSVLFHNLAEKLPRNSHVLAYPPCCLTLLEFDIDNWPRIKNHTGQLITVIIPADHKIE